MSAERSKLVRVRSDEQKLISSAIMSAWPEQVSNAQSTVTVISGRCVSREQLGKQ